MSGHKVWGLSGQLECPHQLNRLSLFRSSQPLTRRACGVIGATSENLQERPETCIFMCYNLILNFSCCFKICIYGPRTNSMAGQIWPIDHHFATSVLGHVGSDTKATKNLWLIPTVCSVVLSPKLSPQSWWSTGSLLGSDRFQYMRQYTTGDETSSKWLRLSEPQQSHLKNGEYVCLLIWCPKMDTISFLWCLYQNAWLNPITRKHETKSNWRRFYKLTDLLLLKNVNIMKDKDRMRKYSRHNCSYSWFRERQRMKALGAKC